MIPAVGPSVRVPPLLHSHSCCIHLCVRLCVHLCIHLCIHLGRGFTAHQHGSWRDGVFTAHQHGSWRDGVFPSKATLGQLSRFGRLRRSFYRSACRMHVSPHMLAHAVSPGSEPIDTLSLCHIEQGMSCGGLIGRKVAERPSPPRIPDARASGGRPVGRKAAAGRTPPRIPDGRGAVPRIPDACGTVRARLAGENRALDRTRQFPGVRAPLPADS